MLLPVIKNVWKPIGSFLTKRGVGLLPEGYNVRVHGAYDPGRYYGKVDTNIWDVKIGELPGWLARRQKSPFAMARGVSRSYYRYQRKWQTPKYTNLADFVQICVIGGFGFYMLKYNLHQHEKYVKYH